MEYKYCPKANYEDFASGRVLYHVGGAPNFPVRLINEIYGRSLEYSNKKTDICLYDCCCGGGYSLTVLGLINQKSISRIIASDVDEKMLEVARKNLSLLSVSGMKKRIDEIHLLYEQYHKRSHKEAEASALRLLELLEKEIEVQIFRANALEKIHADIRPDIIITDVPYGNLVDWNGEAGDIGCLLESLSGICSCETVVAICMDKRQKISSTGFKRLERQNVGKRKFEIYKLETNR